MKVRLILIGMVAGLLLPLAAANARTVFDPGLTQSGAGADVVRGTTPSAGNFVRDGDEDKGDHQCDKDHDRDDHRCDKSPSQP